jgi:chromosome partitioning protein
MAQILAVINQKGGTAKTTTSVALAAQYAHAGKRVLLIDVDPQANATLAFGVDAAALQQSVYDVLVREVPLDEVIVSTHISKLHLAPGHVNLSRTDINLADRERKQFRLKEAIAKSVHRYDHVIIDCPPSFGLLPVNALVAAEAVIIPLAPQYFALEGLKQVQVSIESIRKELNPALRIAGILFCLVDRRLKITVPAMDMVRAHYQGQALNTIVHMCAKVNESHLAGQTIFEYAPDCTAAIEYTALAEEVVQRMNSRSPEAQISESKPSSKSDTFWHDRFKRAFLANQ